MLVDYQQRTQLLLNDSKMERFNLFDIASYINQARGQLAGDSECIRVYSTLALTGGTQQYPFSAIAFPVGTTGVQGVLSVRTASYQVASGALPVYPRPWPWFNTFYLGNAAPTAGPPSIYSQYGQGVNGTLFVNLPDGPYTLNLDTACYPEALADDSTPEAIPYLWTDAVPYYAAYLALLPVSGQEEKAAQMFKLYMMFANRARQAATPGVLQNNYEQVSDPTLANKLGSQPFRTASDLGIGAEAGRASPTGR